MQDKHRTNKILEMSLITSASTSGTRTYNLHSQVTINFSGFEVLTAVVMKISVFWDTTQCSPLEVNIRQTTPKNRTSHYIQSHKIKLHTTQTEESHFRIDPNEYFQTKITTTTLAKSVCWHVA
jgi:hypothetical protein